MSYNFWSQEEVSTFEDDIEDETYEEPLFDESILTPLQSLEVDELEKENPMLTREDLAVMLRMNLVSYRAALEGRYATMYEIMMAQQLKEVIYWVPPSQLEGISDSNFELHEFDNSHLPYVEDVTSDFESSVLVNECLDLICETQRLDDLRVEKFARDYHEVCFDMNYLCTSVDLESNFLMLEESKTLLEQVNLGNELDVDKLLHEIELSQVEKDHENVTIVYYMVDGDNVDYSLENSFKPVVDFVFPPNAFDSHDQPTIKDYIMTYATFVVNSLDEKSVYYLWAVVCSFAHFVSCSCRRRTKGALAQPFDSCD